MSMVMKDLTADDKERIIGLEARMRGVPKNQMSEHFRQILDCESSSNKSHPQTQNQNSSEQQQEQPPCPSRNDSVTNSLVEEEGVNDQPIRAVEKQPQKKILKKEGEGQTPKKKLQVSRQVGVDIPSNKKITEFFDNNTKVKQKKLSDKKMKKPKSQFEGYNPVQLDYNLGKDEQISKLVEDLQNANRMLVDKDIQLKEKQQIIDQFQVETKELKSQEHELKNQFQANTERFNKSIDAIKQFVLETERLRRIELRFNIGQQKYRLGDFALTREGTKITEQWVDGNELKEIKIKLKGIEAQKEELEKRKKNKQKREDDELSRISINLKIAMLLKEEQSLNEQLERMEHEKHLFVKQIKRQFEEDHCRFGKLSYQAGLSQWPVVGDRYQLVGLLGKGGFSEVYKAYDLLEIREVACKIHQLNSTWSELSKQNYIKHAIRENRVHRQLSHPHIVKLFDSVEMDQNSFCTVLEYCDGPDLSFYLQKYKIFPEKEAKLIITQILSALKYLNNHRNKIIHYDLKPQNILFHKGDIKVSDFGLCKVLENEETRLELTSQGVGTYWYLPPECFQIGDNPPAISSKVDIWSIGVIFYEMLFGQKPFGQGISQEKILKDQVILNSKQVNFPQRPAISQECRDFIKGCLSYSQMDRLDVYSATSHVYFQKKL